MTDSESDIEMKTAVPRNKMPPKMAPASPLDDLQKTKKITTKMMITDALIKLKTRKGVSLYAIKKYLTENYNVDTEKGNYLIKKSLKSGVEDGTFIQLKGIGASGSFKLANTQEKPKPKKKQEIKTKKTEKNENKTEVVKKDTKKKKTMSKTKIAKEEKPEKPKKMKIKKDKAEKTTNKVETKVRTKKAVSENEDQKSKAKSWQSKASTKKRAMMKRKSIGSIIKPPKMKPKLTT